MDRHCAVKMRYQTALYVEVLLGLMLMSGCGGGRYLLLPFVPTSTPVASQAGSVSITPKYAALGAGGSTQFAATVAGGGTVQWLVNGIAGGNTTVGTVSASGLYTAPATFVQSQNVIVSADLASAPQSDYATAVMSLLSAGIVTNTANPQVASYTMNLPVPGTVYVEFGKDVTYGFPTSAQATPAKIGGGVTVLVAGMLGIAQYHMRAQVVLSDGAIFTDSDHTFNTGQPPSSATVTTSVMGSGNPQPGIELFDTLLPHETAQAFATDLSGNVIWTYTYNGAADDLVYPIRLLPNGHFLALISYASSVAVHQGGVGAVLPGTLDEVREFDLAGTTIRSVTAAQLIAAAAANPTLSAELKNTQLGSLHHDVLLLPNGHMVMLFSATQTVDVQPAVVGAQGVVYQGPTPVLGDVVVDVDQNFNPDWVWNAFTYLNPNRIPWPAQFPDWTHSNALLYSTDDGNLLISVRHQNWIIKIDFEDGKGIGRIMWHLGKDGEFKLVGGTDPTDWFYAQHGPNFFSVNTTDLFTLGLMDNGNDRQFPSGENCASSGASPSPTLCYSMASVLQVNEAQKTATLVEHYIDPGATGPVYSFFGGNFYLMANGDREVDFCAATAGSIVQELRGASGSEQVVWQAVTPGTKQYRTERLPSLYPGIQW